MLMDKLNADMKQAMLDKNKLNLSVIRMVKAAIQKQELDLRRPLEEAEVLDAINKQIKTREDSIREFEKGNRQDLIDATNLEIDVLKTYMPEPLTEAEVNTIITSAISEVNATSIKDLGSVMKIVTPLLKGRTDMSKVSEIIKNILN